MPISTNLAQELIVSSSVSACVEINTFSRKVLSTRGGRMGSGMGMLLEALWCYYVNQVLYSLPAGKVVNSLGWRRTNTMTTPALLETGNGTQIQERESFSESKQSL